MNCRRSRFNSQELLYLTLIIYCIVTFTASVVESRKRAAQTFVELLMELCLLLPSPKPDAEVQIPMDNILPIQLMLTNSKI